LDGLDDEILQVLRDILAPLVEADGGQLFWVPSNPPQLALHLTGRFMGSPGNGLVGRRIVEPVLKAVAPDSPVVLSSGWKVPVGAVRVHAKS